MTTQQIRLSSEEQDKLKKVLGYEDGFWLSNRNHRIDANKAWNIFSELFPHYGKQVFQLLPNYYCHSFKKPEINKKEEALKAFIDLPKFEGESKDTWEHYDILVDAEAQESRLFVNPKAILDMAIKLRDWKFDINCNIIAKNSLENNAVLLKELKNICAEYYTRGSKVVTEFKSPIIEATVYNFRKNQELEQKNLLKEKIKFNKEATSNWCEVFLNALFPKRPPEEVMHQNLAIIKRCIWQIKRKTFYSDFKEWPFLFSFYSQQGGIGKSHNISRVFLSPLQNFMKKFENAEKVLDQWSQESIMRSPVIYIEELGDVLNEQPKLVPKFKSLISSQDMENRQMHSHEMTTLANRITIVCTTNCSLYNTITEESNATHRRILEIDLGYGRDTNETFQFDIKTLNEIPIEKMWQEVNEDGECPLKLANVDKLVLENAAKKRGKSQFEKFAVFFDLIDSDTLSVADGVWYKSIDILKAMGSRLGRDSGFSRVSHMTLLNSFKTLNLELSIKDPHYLTPGLLVKLNKLQDKNELKSLLPEAIYRDDEEDYAELL